MDDRPFSTETTVFVTTIGDQANFDDCLAHLECQTLGCRIEVIDHVAPMSAAFQQMYERCQTPFYIQVDEDMILFPEAVQELEEKIRQAPPEVVLICAPLWDCDVEHTIQGLKIYRHSIVKQFPYEDAVGFEVAQVERLRAAGYSARMLPMDRANCLGEHGKHYTPRTIFLRWQKCLQKHLAKRPLPWVESYPQWLLKRYLESRDPLHLYALLGAVAGIADPAAAQTGKDWRVPNEALERMLRYFPVTPESKVPGKVEEPKTIEPRMNTNEHE